MIKRSLIIMLAAGLLAAVVGIAGANEDVRVESNIRSINIETTDHDHRFPIRYSEERWMQIIDDDFAYYILRSEGTERAFSGKLNTEKRSGIYYSRATGQPIFSSEHKYESGTGWPSFWRPVTLDAVAYHVDRSLFGTRIEVVDSSSGSHLGHVFRDGPRPTGLRFCLNSAALIFVPDGHEPPAIVKEYKARNIQISSTR